MGFLNQSILQKKAAAATAEKHPLLKECDVPPNVKQAYLQGCVLAVLERDDGMVTDAARQEITRLGLSLQMTEEDIGECISVASGLNSPEMQDEFLSEFFSTLAGDAYSRFFMEDFGTLLCAADSGFEDKGQIVMQFQKGFRLKENDLVNLTKSYTGLANKSNAEIGNVISGMKVRYKTRRADIVSEREVVIGDAYVISFLDPCHFIISPNLEAISASTEWEYDSNTRRERIFDIRHNMVDAALSAVCSTIDEALGGHSMIVDCGVYVSLPRTPLRDKLSCVPCGYSMKADKLGRALRETFIESEVVLDSELKKIFEDEGFETDNIIEIFNEDNEMLRSVLREEAQECVKSLRIGDVVPRVGKIEMVSDLYNLLRPYLVNAQNKEGELCRRM